MAAGLDFAGMVPGFDFLQGLMKGAGAAMPPMGQWVAPTLDPAELDKRIGELKTVQFWLEQNAKLLGTTIQAMEVQRMTLATLQTMNLPMADLRDALSIRPSAAPAFTGFAPPPAPAPAPAPEPPVAVAIEPVTEPEAETAAPAAAAVDPMKWWGALTQQFTEIAAKAMQAGAVDAAAAGSVAPAPAAARRPAAAPKRASKGSAKVPARKKPSASKTAAAAAGPGKRRP